MPPDDPGGADDRNRQKYPGDAGDFAARQDTDDHQNGPESSRRASIKENRVHRD
jgi:hypothetical protein